jgi:hypothetical protein
LWPIPVVLTGIASKPRTAGTIAQDKYFHACDSLEDTSTKAHPASIDSISDRPGFVDRLVDDGGGHREWQRLTSEPICFWADRMESLCKVAHSIIVPACVILYIHKLVQFFQ